MQLLSKISGATAALVEKQEVALTDTGLLERWGLSRRSGRSFFNRDNAFAAYAAHELVYACINKIADVMNDAEIIVERKNGKGEWEPIDGHLLTALFKRPNGVETGRDFRRLMVQSEQACGIFYGEMIRSRAGIVVEIHPLNPNRVNPKLNRDRSGIAYFEYTKADGRRYPIKPEDMLIRRRSDLVNRFFGLSPLSVALKSINSDLGMTDYVDAFFESDGTPSGILKILNATVPDIKRESILQQWKRKFSRGGSSQKGIAVLDQNVDFQRLGSNLDELASDSVSGRFESRICSVFGVNPILVGAYVGLLHVTTNATAKAALRDFWDNKINGELSTLREWLTWYVLPEFESVDLIRAEKVRVGFDISHVGFLKEDADKIHERSRNNFKAGGWTLNEFRQATGMPPDPKGDYYLQPLNLTALSPENRAAEAVQKVEQGKQPAQLAPAPEDTGKSESIQTLEEKKTKKSVEYDGVMLGREPVGVELVISLKTIVSDFETERERATRVLNAFRDQLIDQAVEKIAKLDTSTVYQLTLTPDPKTRKAIQKAVLSAFKRGRAQVAQELRDQQAAKNLQPLAAKDDRDVEDLEFLTELTDALISRIINQMQSRAIDTYVLLKSLLDYTVDKLRERLESESVKFIEQMAGNTVNAAISTGRYAAFEEHADQIKTFQYSAILDQNTCNQCADADGLEANDADDLPAAPNPDCDGGDRCRCFIVAIAD